MEEFIDDRNPSPGEDPPARAVVTRRVKRGREQEFVEWVPGIITAASKFPGYLDSEILRPIDSENNEYRIIARFDHLSYLHAWETSKERQRWLQKSRPLLEEEEKFNVLTGLETWFTLPSKPGEPPPPRYKMAIVTWLGVFPIIAVLYSLFGHWLFLFPTLLRAAVFSVVMVTLMTYCMIRRPSGQWIEEHYEP